MPSLLCVLVGCLSLLTTASPAQAASPAASGQLFAFGSNFWGQLGNATNNVSDNANPTPVFVSLPQASGAVTAASAGNTHSLALTSTGQLYAFGSNLYGQLGSAANAGAEGAEPPEVVTLTGASGPVTQIAAGGWYSLALTATGQMFAFGENTFGQLGNGASTANPTPTIVDLPGASGPVTEIAAGANHSLAATATGQLYAFGENSYGQLGNWTNVGVSNAANPIPTPVSLPGADGPVTQVAAGGYHSLALTAGGQLYAFGENGYGQLGNSVNIGYGYANPTPTLVELPGATGPVTQIAAGFHSSLALTSTGQLFAFGENAFGQLGNLTNNGTNLANPTPTLVELPGATGSVVRIAAGALQSLAVTSTGQLFAFGENDFGQLGSGVDNGTGNANPIPTMVSQPEGDTVETVAGGSSAYHELEVIANLAVLNGSLPAGQVAVPYGTGAQAGGGTAPYTWSASGLPAGLSIDPTTGAIGGTPTAAGSANVVLSVTDAHGISASATLPLAVAAQPIPAKPSPPTTSVGPFEMYFEATRRGHHLRLTSIVVISLSPGERVSYTCENCSGRPRKAAKSARQSKLTFAIRGLIVTSRSRLKITVTAKDGSKRVRTYTFTFGRPPRSKLKSQQCFPAGGRLAISCRT